MCGPHLPAEALYNCHWGCLGLRIKTRARVGSGHLDVVRLKSMNDARGDPRDRVRIRVALDYVGLGKVGEEGAVMFGIRPEVSKFERLPKESEEDARNCCSKISDPLNNIQSEIRPEGWVHESADIFWRFIDSDSTKGR